MLASRDMNWRQPVTAVGWSHDLPGDTYERDSPPDIHRRFWCWCVDGQVRPPVCLSTRWEGTRPPAVVVGFPKAECMAFVSRCTWFRPFVVARSMAFVAMTNQCLVMRFLLIYPAY